MAGSTSTNAQRKMTVPLTLVDQGANTVDHETTFIVVGEAGEELAFEICEDIDIAIDVREMMMSDGFQVRVYEASEVEIVSDAEPAGPA